MPHDARTLLEDIRRAADRIARFTAGRTLDNYGNDEMVRGAVERQFEIIGEALSRLAKVDAALMSKIPNHRQIIAFRNQLIQDPVVWDIVQKDLPVLMRQVEMLLAAK